jgi:nicotinate-nucleotide adenylyltransferase
VRLGLFGGGFDPIHRGHVEPARKALEVLSLDRVNFLPTGRPPHKASRQLAPAWSRFAMVELALLDEPLLQASPFELSEGAPSYTVETLRHFAARHPAAELFLLLGADAFLDLPNWRNWAEIAQLATLVVFSRPGFDAELGAREEHAELLRRGRVRRLDSVAVDVSATEIRRRLTEREPMPPEWLDERVLKYALKYSLYR